MSQKGCLRRVHEIKPAYAPTHFFILLFPHFFIVISGISVIHVTSEKIIVTIDTLSPLGDVTSGVSNFFLVFKPYPHRCCFVLAY